ncbi:MAG: TolC family outer membrane protein, partial [Pseudomonadota bacterium]|nr:TolC family outer membrane protein [Pseudomonadota bacterium]
AALLPTLNAAGTAAYNAVRQEVRVNPPVVGSDAFFTFGLTISAAQPLFRLQNIAVLQEAGQQVVQADYVLASAQQDLIVRVAQAYFDVLLSQFTVELTESQKVAVSEQLSQAKRNFEVGVSTITDTNEAQARYDTIVAQEIAARNDLENKRTALRAIIGRAPGELKRLGPGFEPAVPEPNNLEYWTDRALNENYAVRVARTNLAIAGLEIERARAAHLPTLDLVASYGQSAATGAVSSSGSATSADLRGRTAVLGLQLAVPIYQGGLVQSRVREAIALEDRSRQDLETNRRNALFLAQTGFSGVTSAAASIKAFEQALISAQSAYESNRLGLEVGVRTTLDVLNVQQTVFQTRRDLAQAYFNYLVGLLRLKSAAGTLTDGDLEDVNRRLAG